MWLSRISGHSADGLRSLSGSTIKLPCMHTVTSQCLPWYDFRCCQDVKTPTINQPEPVWQRGASVGEDFILVVTWLGERKHLKNSMSNNNNTNSSFLHFLFFVFGDDFIHLNIIFCQRQNTGLPAFEMITFWSVRDNVGVECAVLCTAHVAYCVQHTPLGNNTRAVHAV